MRVSSATISRIFSPSSITARAAPSRVAGGVPGFCNSISVRTDSVAAAVSAAAVRLRMSAWTSRSRNWNDGSLSRR